MNNYEYDSEYIDDDFPEDNQDGDGVIEYDGHRDRIRLRILEGGVDALPPVQMMEFLLYYVLPRQDVHSVSCAVMDYFGDIRRVFAASLEDFRQIKGLGENGAQWLDMISRLTRRFATLGIKDAVTVKNRLELLTLTRRMQPLYPAPYCMQVLTDENGLLLMRRPLARTLEWAQLDVLRSALRDASGSAARNAYMIVFTADHTRHPSQYDLDNIRKYALLLKHSECTLRDVMFFSSEGYISMHRMNLIPDVMCIDRVHRQVAEDRLENLQERDLKIMTLSTHEHSQEEL